MQLEQLLKPKYDVVFHCLFRKGNERITKALISAILGKKIEEIELDNDRYLLQEYPKQKMGILDLNAKFEDGTICNIEIQLEDKGNMEKRILLYWSRLYGAQLKVKEDYNKLSKTIVILIADYDIKMLKGIEDVHTTWRIRGDQYKEMVLTNDLEMHIISLAKARKAQKSNSELMWWLTFLDNPNNEGVKEMGKKNKDIAEALWKLEDISEDKKLRRIAELEEKWRIDEISAKNYWKKSGLEEGREEGRTLGREEGKKEEKIKIAKEMLKNGADINFIKKCTELTEKEIQDIKSNMDC